MSTLKSAVSICYFISCPLSKSNTARVCVCVCVRTQSCPTLCDPLDYNLPSSSAHGISQAKILQSVATSYSKGSSWPRNLTHVFCISGIGRWILYDCTTQEAQYCPCILHAKLLHLWPTLWKTMDCGPPGSSVHGLSQMWILKWIAILFSRGSFWHRDRNQASWIASRFFTSIEEAKRISKEIKTEHRSSREIWSKDVTQWASYRNHLCSFKTESRYGVYFHPGGHWWPQDDHNIHSMEK